MADVKLVYYCLFLMRLDFSSCIKLLALKYIVLNECKTIIKRYKQDSELYKTDYSKEIKLWEEIYTRTKKYKALLKQDGRYFRDVYEAIDKAYEIEERGE